ncbi:MAG: hypothetical protein ACTSPI_08555, partial [Candidatus Heimdallarchaeaceae archaeon]
IEYFDSDFVKKYWCIDLNDRLDAWNMLLEALCLGARIKRVKDLSKQWGMTFEDSMEYLKRNTQPNNYQKEGMEIFITEVLDMEIDEYWGKVVEEGNEQTKQMS